MVESRAKQNIGNASKQPGKFSIDGCTLIGLAPDHRCSSADSYTGIHNVCAQKNELTSYYIKLSIYCSIFCKRLKVTQV